MSRNKSTLLTAIIIALLLFMSCSEEDASITVGEDWIQSDTRVIYIDTIEVNSSTFKFDSLAVSSTDRLLLGSYQDPIFGKTESKIFTQLANSTYTLDRDAVFDSIALILHYDDYYYNDTTQVQSLKVYELLQSIKPSDDGSFYTTTSFDYDENPVGELVFIPEPTREDSLHLRLNDSYGRLLFSELRDNEINNSDEFLNAHRGLLLSPGANNTVILGFLPTSSVRLYYSLPDELEDDTLNYFDMDFNSSYSFHAISSDRTGTYFETLKDQENVVSSTEAGGMSYVQGGVGLATRIEIPNLSGLDYIEGKGTLLSANLFISLNTDTETSLLPAGESLSAYILDNKNEILGTLYDYEGNEVIASVTTKSSEFSQLTYGLPIHYFLDQKRSATNGDNWYLTLTGTEQSQSVNRYGLFGQDSSNDNLRLQIQLIYAVYDQD